MNGGMIGTSVRVQIFDMLQSILFKIASGRKVAGAIRSMVNARDQQFECAMVLHEALVVPVLLYGSDTMI